MPSTMKLALWATATKVRDRVSPFPFVIVTDVYPDTQSWFHSQEVNLMVDSKQVVAEWMAALHSNQNTQQYGMVGTDGVWRYESGKPLESLNANAGGGPLARLKGFVGMFVRATGA